MKILIVDDEPIAQNILERYIEKLGGAEIAGKCSNALEAFALLGRSHIDLVLLDINMPGMSGIDLVQTLKNPPLVIFTTAYSEYAVKSYDLDAVDYLVKPISFERFLKAIDKVNALLHKVPTTMAAPVAAEKPLFVKSGRQAGKD